jgi:hypothetical protein
MPQPLSSACAHAILLSLLVATWIGCTPSEEPSPDDAGAAIQQQAETARDRLAGSEGGQLVLRAIEAHGGLEAWYRAPTSSYTWEYANEGSDVQFKSFLVADNRTRHVYHDLMTLGPYGNPQPIDARFAWNGEIAWMAPDSIERPNPHFWATTGYYFEQIPFVLADPGLTYERLPDDTLDGTAYELVKAGYEEGVGYSDDDTYTLYVNAETGIVDAIRYTVTYGRDVPDDAEMSETLFYYEDYITVDGLTVPTHFRGYRYADGERGAFRNEAWADSISFRRPFDASRLEPPEGARIVEPPPIES